MWKVMLSLLVFAFVVQIMCLQFGILFQKEIYII
jgi:hypothetical protein